MEWIDPAYAPGHWVPQMVEIAGGEPALGRAGEKSTRITPEEIVAARPDIVVLMPCGFSLERTVAEYRRTTMFAGWDALPAVQRKQVYAVDGSAYFSRCGPRLIDGVEILASIIRPDRFSREQHEQNRDFENLS
jgi:iron complex transport system substrate-binding protein